MNNLKAGDRVMYVGDEQETGIPHGSKGTVMGSLENLSEFWGVRMDDTNQILVSHFSEVVRLRPTVPTIGHDSKLMIEEGLE